MRAALAVSCAVLLLLAGAVPAEAHTRPRRHVRHPAVVTGPAPSEATWERLAGCEASHNWHLRDGRYTGGLQFDRSTWRAVGGTGQAWQATRAEQIARASSLWRQRGFQPWPACSRRLGLR